MFCLRCSVTKCHTEKVVPTSTAKLDWYELIELHVVRKVAELVGRRWNLGFGYIDIARRQGYPPVRVRSSLGRGPCQLLQDNATGRKGCSAHAQKILGVLESKAAAGSLRSRPFELPCHAGLTELVAPVIIDGVLYGALLCGGYVPEDHDASGLDVVSEYLPRLSAREISFVEDLLEEAAGEISAFLVGAGKIASLSSGGELRSGYESIIGAAPSMQALYSLLDRIATSDSTVLITGENGTGKELVAKAIHAVSPRKDKPFVVQNCSAFNDNLLDSELFGHKRGAFTGAVTDKKGLFEVADKGTFFLDEIGDMSSSLQVKVLRVLQEGTFMPVGGTETKKVDVRIIAATNRDLKTMVEEGTFREDLYYRINVINLRLPPMRERLEDLELLVRHFLDKHGGDGKRLSSECVSLLRSYAWPGNVRELENEIERLIVLSGNSPLLAAELLSERMRRGSAGNGGSIGSEPTSSLPDAVKALEKRMIHAALVEHDWNKTRAAAQLQVSRRNLIRLVQKYELE